VNRARAVAHEASGGFCAFSPAHPARNVRPVATILVVEDDPDACEIMRTAMTRAGHATTCVPNGRDALAALTAVKPELIILDLRLPVMDGAAFLQVLRSYLRWYTVPVIVVSAAHPSELERIEPYDVTRVFRKADFDVSELEKSVADALGKRARNGA
jgi:DNA-binding response OmpR family regulator